MFALLKTDLIGCDSFLLAEGIEQALQGLGKLPVYIMCGYLLLLLVLGCLGWVKSQAGEEDYYLASRGQGWVISSVTIMATFFSSAALLGAPGMVYREGVMFALFSLNVPLAGVCVYVLGSRIWKVGRHYGYLTPGDMVADYYGHRTLMKILVALAGFLYVIPYVVIQIQAGGVLTEKLFEGENTFAIGASVLAAITMIYIMVGGMRSVSWTDLVQGILLIAGMLISGLAMLMVFESPAKLGTEISTKLPDSSLTIPGNTGAWEWTLIFSVCIFGSTGSMVQPAQWMRFYSAKSVQTLKRASVIFAVVLTTCFMAGVMLIGLAGQVMFPLQFSVEESLGKTAGDAPANFVIPESLSTNLHYHHDKETKEQSLSWNWQGKEAHALTTAQKTELLAANTAPQWETAIEELDKKIKTARPTVNAHPEINDYNSILVVVVSQQLPKQFPWMNFGAIIASLIIIAIMAASMSTADSNLHAFSALATRDLYDEFIRPDASENERVWVGRLVILGATVFSLWIVIAGHQQDLNSKYSIFATVMEMSLVAIAFSSQLLPLTIDMLFLHKGTGKGAAAGLAAGLLVTFLSSEMFKLLSESFGNPALFQAMIDNITAITKTVKVHGSVWGLLVNVPIFVIVSLMTRQSRPEKIAEYKTILKSLK